MELVTTGIDPLDVFLGGGLPRGYTTLLLAPSGGGSEIFAKQFATGKGGRTIYISTDETGPEVLQAAADGGWSFEDVEIVDLETAFAKMMLREQGPEVDRARSFDPRDLVEGATMPELRIAYEDEDDSDYLGRLIRPFERGESPARLVVHSLDFFLNLYSLERVAAVLTALKAANARGGGQLLMVVAKGAHDDKAERRLELLADCVIELEVNRKGTTFERFFLVKKVKNRPNAIGVSTYKLGQSGISLETLERIV